MLPFPFSLYLMPPTVVLTFFFCPFLSSLSCCFFHQLSLFGSLSISICLPKSTCCHLLTIRRIRGVCAHVSVCVCVCVCICDLIFNNVQTPTTAGHISNCVFCAISVHWKVSRGQSQTCPKQEEKKKKFQQMSVIVSTHKQCKLEEHTIYIHLRLLEGQS